MNALLRRLRTLWRRHLLAEARWHMVIVNALQDAAERLRARDHDPTDEAGA